MQESGAGSGARMMYPVIRKLQQKRVVLASASPRRQEILSQAVCARGGPGLGSVAGAWEGGGGYGRGRGVQLGPSDPGPVDWRPGPSDRGRSLLA